MVTTTQLRKLRLKYHITLTELADAVGFSNQYLSALEQGKAAASREQKDRISRVFIQLANERSGDIRALDKELVATKDRLFMPMEVEQGEL